MPPSTTRVAVVTGATGAIGRAMARRIAERPGFEVVLACRDGVRAELAGREIVRATGHSAVRFEPVDVSRRSSVEALAARWNGPLHVLVNNAAGGVTANACHPGDVRSALSGNLGFGGSQTPDEGARTPAWLATGPTGGRITGRVFESLKEVPCPFGADRAAVEALYRACTGI
jgi:hypothetical protein